MIHTILAGITMTSLYVAYPATTQGSPITARLPVPESFAVRQFATGVEEPALYAMLLAVANMPAPATQTAPLVRDTPDSAASQASEIGAQSLDRQRLLAGPGGQVGDLLTTSGLFIETKPLSLVSASDTLPRQIWSTLLVERNSRQPIQVLTISEPTPLGRLANVRCLGYFYKIRQDKAQKPGPSGQVAVVDVPVLVGWVWPETVAQPMRGHFTYYVLPAIIGMVFVVFMIVAMAGRQRTDWRSRVNDHRRGRAASNRWRDQVKDKPDNHDE